jgi:two-component system NtrC family sensor kinase
MVPPVLRTLSARVVLGFAVLIVAFGVTTGFIVNYMDQVVDEVSVIRTAYLTLAFQTKELDRQEEELISYLDDLVTELSAKRAERALNGMRSVRGKTLHEIDKVLGELDEVPERHQAQIATTRRDVQEIESEVTQLDAMYKALLAAPPLDKRADGMPANPALTEAAEKARVELKEREGRIQVRTSDLAKNLKSSLIRIATNLERNEARLRMVTLVLGLAAILVGLLITLWATVNLRPLRRLRDAAKRIAAGDYASRIDESGPSEVADLAREFNVMGRAVQERERELVRSERLAAVGKMAAMITHEVRNPLSSIGLNTELLEEELGALPEAAEARALCRAITREVDRLAAITEDYLAFARLPTPRLAAEHLDTVVGNLATFVREDLAARAVTLEVALAGDLPRAWIDEGQIRQALLNLVRNAAEAVASDGHVWLRTRRGADPDRVEVEVADDGPGIPADALPRLFDPFFSTKEGGTGLGLALTQQIVRDHGGDIRVTSRPGQGASFVVSVPVAAETTVAPPITVPEAHVTALTSEG